MDADFLINKLFDYYEVYSISELANKIGVKQPIISGWKSRNSINPIKKKCRELGIYTEIFGDINREIYNIHGAGSVSKVTGTRGVGIYNAYNREVQNSDKKEFHFQEEYEKIENLAKMGKGYENLKGLLEELKEQLKEDV